MVRKYVKKPIPIEAIQFFYSNKESMKELNNFCGSKITSHCDVGDVLFDIHNDCPTLLYVKTLEGDMRISHGDFIIKGISGEFYPCKEDIFKATYEEVK